MADRLIPAWWGEHALQYHKPGDRYHPSNGTEGACFIDAWCCRCARDENEDCPILAASFAGEIPEWIYGVDGYPKCTQFVQSGDAIPAPRCTKTVDMFDGCGHGEVPEP